MLHRAVFLDRDGTICYDLNHCSRLEDFQLIPGAAGGIRRWSAAGFLTVVVTNQSGIARGYFTEETLNEIHDRMLNDLDKLGAHIEAIYYCPHHPDQGCTCRKPKPGMLERASESLQIDLNASFMVGDKSSDVETARAVGCNAVLVGGTSVCGTVSEPRADYYAKDLYEASGWIVAQSKLKTS